MLLPHRELHYRRGVRCSIDDKYNKRRAVLTIMAVSSRVLLRRIEVNEHYSRMRQKLRCILCTITPFCRRTIRRGFGKTDRLLPRGTEARWSIIQNCIRIRMQVINEISAGWMRINEARHDDDGPARGGGKNRPENWRRCRSSTSIHAPRCRFQLSHGMGETNFPIQFPDGSHKDLFMKRSSRVKAGSSRDSRKMNEEDESSSSDSDNAIYARITVVKRYQNNWKSLSRLQCYLR